MCVVQDEFQGHLTDARVHNGQRARTRREGDCQGNNALPLGLWQRVTLPRESVGARALNREAGAECAIGDTFTGILWAPYFPVAGRGLHFLSYLPPSEKCPLKPEHTSLTSVIHPSCYVHWRNGPQSSQSKGKIQFLFWPTCGFPSSLKDACTWCLLALPARVT